MMTCRNCGHPSGEHPGGSRCAHATETLKERTECACPAYNVRPVPLRAQLTDAERARVLAAQVNDLDRQIGALQQRRDDAARRLAAIAPAAKTA